MLNGNGVWDTNSKMKKKVEGGNEIAIAVILILVLLIIFGGFGMMGLGGYGMMGIGYGTFSGFWPIGYIIHILFIVALVLFIMWLIRQLQGQK